MIGFLIRLKSPSPEELRCVRVKIESLGSFELEKTWKLARFGVQIFTEYHYSCIEMRNLGVCPGDVIGLLLRVKSPSPENARFVLCE